MAEYTNIITCNTANSNTGVPQCSFDFSLIEKVMLVPKGYKMTQTEIQTAQTVLQAKANNSTESLRGYPIGKFIGMEPKTTETSINTTPYGDPFLGKKGKFHFVFEYKNGGMNYDVMLNTFENAQDSYDIILFDKVGNAIVGTPPDDNTSGYVFQGLSLSLLYCPLPQITPEGTRHFFAFGLADTDELMKNMAYYALPASQKVNNIVGLRNLELKIHTAFTGTTGKLRITTDGGAVSLGSSYGTAIAALSSNFSVTNLATGAAIVITSITYTAATDSFNFVVPSITSGTQIMITPPTVAQLTATVPGFAGQPLITTVA